VHRGFGFEFIQRHRFNGLFSRTTWVSRHEKGYTNLNFNEARDDRVVAFTVLTMLDGHQESIWLVKIE